MSQTEITLTLPRLDEVDKLGGYKFGQIVSPSTGHTLATYEWEPTCGHTASKAVVYLLHGVFGHTAFEWLAADDRNHRVLLVGSLVDRLLQLGLSVIAHDHPGHGRSSGLHGYVDSHDELRDASVDVIRYYGERFSGKRSVVIGMSMGGTTAIRVCEKEPNLVDAYVLFSPAVRPPDDMFGWQGQFLRFISPILAATVPKLPVLSLPPSTDPVIRDATQKDGLLYKGPMRVRMGVEFLRVYSEVNECAHTLQFRSVAIFIGMKDQIVSPSGVKDFVKRINSDDKHLVAFDEFGHDVFREQGTEIVIDKVVAWVEQWLSKNAS